MEQANGDNHGAAVSVVKSHLPSAPFEILQHHLSNMSASIVLISGANRGLGKGLLEQYLARPDHIVVAANRNPDHVSSKKLADLPKGSGSRLIVVKVDSNSNTDAAEAVKELEAQGVNHLDVVIANAGVMYAYAPVSEMKIADMEGHMLTNVYGTVRLFQATLPLLLRSEKPKWITIGSAPASIVVCYVPVDLFHAFGYCVERR